MAFVVTQRRREIGIRAGLGADPRRLVQATFGRAAMQMLAGVAVGAAVAVGMDQIAGGECCAAMRRCWCRALLS